MLTIIGPLVSWRGGGGGGAEGGGGEGEQSKYSSHMEANQGPRLRLWLRARFHGKSHAKQEIARVRVRYSPILPNQGCAAAGYGFQVSLSWTGHNTIRRLPCPLPHPPSCHPFNPSSAIFSHMNTFPCHAVPLSSQAIKTSKRKGRDTPEPRDGRDTPEPREGLTHNEGVDSKLY